MATTVKRNTFRKPEKLCNARQIEKLFNKGKSMSSGQFRMVYLETDEKRIPPVKVVLAVPKKNLKLAVDRNHMKRLLREAYRHGKHDISEMYTALDKHCDIAFIFTGKKCVSQQETDTAINELLNRLLITTEKSRERDVPIGG